MKFSIIRFLLWIIIIGVVSKKTISRMKNSDGTWRKPKHIGLIYAALGLFTLLSTFVAIISLPLGKPVDLGRTGAEGLGQTRAWYTLEAEEYSVGPALGSVDRRFILPFIRVKYTYYAVMVTPEEHEPFVMGVRVCGEKDECLAQGKTVALYGMVSDFTDTQTDQTVESQVGPLQYRCLNDNGDTVVKRALTSIFFFLIAALCVFFIVKLARRSRDESCAELGAG